MSRRESSGPSFMAALKGFVRFQGTDTRYALQATRAYSLFVGLLIVLVAFPIELALLAQGLIEAAPLGSTVALGVGLIVITKLPDDWLWAAFFSLQAIIVVRATIQYGSVTGGLSVVTAPLILLYLRYGTARALAIFAAVLVSLGGWVVTQGIDSMFGAFVPVIGFLAMLLFAFWLTQNMVQGLGDALALGAARDAEALAQQEADLRYAGLMAQELHYASSALQTELEFGRSGGVVRRNIDPLVSGLSELAAGIQFENSAAGGNMVLNTSIDELLFDLGYSNPRVFTPQGPKLTLSLGDEARSSFLANKLKIRGLLHILCRFFGAQDVVTGIEVEASLVGASANDAVLSIVLTVLASDSGALQMMERYIGRDHDNTEQQNGSWAAGELSLTKRWLAELNGSLNSSMANDSSLRIIVQLPVQTSRQEKVISDPDQSVKDWKGRSILVVDDDSLARRVLTNFLSNKLGAFVAQAGDVEEAQRLLADQPVDLVISDFVMPGATGLELVRTVKKQYPQTPIIILTGSGVEADFLQLREAGVNAILGKPLNARILIDSLVKLDSQREIQA